jgi:hypothetical protein
MTSASACSGGVDAGSPARTCANERIVAANRANAARSTGPRTRAGKAVVARNALRHGLSLPVLADPALADEVAGLARRIAGEGASEPRRAAARRIAEAQVDIQRIRRARTQVMMDGFAAADPTARLMRLDRYERRALSRRKFAIWAFDSLERVAAPPPHRDPWAAVAAAARLRGFWQNKAARYAQVCSPPPASEASGGEGLGVGGAACSEQAIEKTRWLRASVVPPPRPRSLRSRGRPSPPTGGRVEARPTWQNKANGESEVISVLPWHDAGACSPPPASEASGGEGLGVGGAACSEQAIEKTRWLRASVVPHPVRRSFAAPADPPRQRAGG